MGTLTGNAILARVQRKLLDETGQQWTTTELNADFGAALRFVIIRKPDAYTVTARHQLSEGVRQSIPTDALALIAVRANMGEDGITEGDAVTFADLEVMNRCEPAWRRHPQSNVVQNYLHDPRDPRVWYCYPPQQFPPHYVELTASTVPAYTDFGTAIPVDDVYEEAIYLYLLGNAYLKNSKRGDATKATAYLAAAESALATLAGNKAAVTARP
jgi:hypothetical protein